MPATYPLHRVHPGARPQVVAPIGAAATGAAVFIIGLALVVAGPAAAQAVPLEDAGGAAPLGAVGAPDPRIDSIFVEWDRDDSPGCALGVYREGGITYARGYGMADLERRVPITPRSVFDIGSTSKQFAAASILLLAQDGKLTLDDDVRRHVPELPEYSRPITIRHLLLHTSGLRDYIGLLTLAGETTDDVTTPEEALDMIVRQRALNFEPGEEHLYSNSGYFLLSVIVERVAGQSLRDFARSRIFEPLGMTRTHYLGSYNDIVADRALAYAPQGSGLRTDMSRWLQLGDGAVFTTVEELLLWDRNFYDPVVGGTTMLEALQAPGSLNSGRQLRYALGLFSDTHRGQPTISHGGAWGGYRAELLRFPDQRFSVATLCNLGTINASQLALRVADVLLEDVLEPASPQPEAAPAPGAAPHAAPVAVPADVLRDLAGTYRNPVSRALRVVAFEDGALQMVLGGTRYPMVPIAADAFELANAPVTVTVTFTAPAAGQPRRLHWAQGDQDPVPFDQLTLVAPTEAELEAYRGTYSSQELDASHSVDVVSGALVLRRPGAPSQPMRALERDEFSAGQLSIRFTRDPTGLVTGYVLDAGRIRNLRFDRAR